MTCTIHNLNKEYLTVRKTLYGYYIVRGDDSIWNNADIAYGTCALEVLLDELEKKNEVKYIKLREHD